MTIPFIKVKTPMNLGEMPSVNDRKDAVLAILASHGDVSLFKHYWWLGNKPLPARKDLETNKEYLKKH